MTCNIPLESSWRGLQLCFRPHCDWRFAQEVMRLQSHGRPRCCNFGTLIWESWDKKPFGYAPVERHKIYYKGEGGGFPLVWAVVSLMCLSCLWLVLALKVLQLCTNHFVLVCAGLCEWVSLSLLPSPIPKLQHALLLLYSVASQGACFDSFAFCCFQFGTCIWVPSRS